MIILSASELSLSFGDTQILNDVSFSVNEGDKLGIIGVNGAGKTSLFRLITGEYTPDRGGVFIAKDKTIGVLEQNTASQGADVDCNLLEFMYSAFDGLLSLEGEISELERKISDTSLTCDEINALSSRLSNAHARYSSEGGLEFRSRCRGMLLRMGFSDEQMALPVKNLSGGQHTRLALCRLLCREPDILMLDEPTNHLDINMLTWLETFLASYKKTVLLISHDRYFLDRITNKTLQIERKGAKLYEGNYTKAKAQQELDEKSLEKRYKQQQKEIARIQANIDFQRRCGQEHNFVTIRAKQKQLDRMEKLSLAPKQKEVRISFASAKSTSNDVLQAKNLAFSYGSAPLIKDLSFLIRKGERVLFLGENGCGKSTLMKLATKQLSALSGSIEQGYNISVAYYDQENRSLGEQNTVFDELRLAYPTKTNGELRSILALFLFTAEDIDKRVASLSGGERARLTLAKLIMKPVNLLVLDEPTNHLDISSCEALEGALEEFDGTIIAVSHDRYFIDSIATRIIELDINAKNGCHDYTLDDGELAYTEYMRLREEREASKEEKADIPSVDESSQKAQYEQRKKEAADKRNAEKRKERAQKRAAELEAEIQSLDEELFGEAATDYMRAAEIEKRKAEAEEELLSLYEEIM